MTAELEEIPGIVLADYGWIRRPSGRYVHPDRVLEGGRRRVFTEEEALEETASAIASVCADCGGPPHDEGRLDELIDKYIDGVVANALQPPVDRLDMQA